MKKSVIECKLIKINRDIYRMLEVNFYENVADELLKFAVIISKTNGKCDGNGNVLVQDKKNHPTWYG